ncbi:hypothetical protein D3C87_2057950 [compost metagenome]
MVEHHRQRDRHNEHNSLVHDTETFRKILSQEAGSKVLQPLDNVDPQNEKGYAEKQLHRPQRQAMPESR